MFDISENFHFETFFVMLTLADGLERDFLAHSL